MHTAGILLTATQIVEVVYQVYSMVCSCIRLAKKCFRLLKRRTRYMAA